MGIINSEESDSKQTKSVKKTAAPQPVAATTAKDEKSGKISKLKSWVRNAVNCCIE